MIEDPIVPSGVFEVVLFSFAIAAASLSLSMML
jgi:hypothetical protein